MGPAGSPSLHRRLESELRVERQAAAAQLHGLVRSHEDEVWLYLAAGPGVPLGLSVAAHFPQPGHFLWVERREGGWAAVDVEMGRPLREAMDLTEEALAAMVAASGAECLLSSARDGLGFLRFEGTWVELDASVLDRPPPSGPLLLESAELGGLLPRGTSSLQILAAHWRLGLAGIGVAAGLLASALWLWPGAGHAGAAAALAPAAPPAIAEAAALPGPDAEAAPAAKPPPLPEPAPPPPPPAPPAPLTAAQLLASLAGLAVWLHAQDAATASIRLTEDRLCWEAALAPQSLGDGLRLPAQSLEGAGDGEGNCTPLSSPAMRGLAARLSGLLPAGAALAGDGLDSLDGWTGRGGDLRLHTGTPLSWLALGQRLREHPRVRLLLFRARLSPSGDWRDVRARLDWSKGGGDGAF